jgi:hypothetical protein
MSMDVSVVALNIPGGLWHACRGQNRDCDASILAKSRMKRTLIGQNPSPHQQNVGQCDCQKKDGLQPSQLVSRRLQSAVIHSPSASAFNCRAHQYQCERLHLGRGAITKHQLVTFDPL